MTRLQYGMRRSATGVALLAVVLAARFAAVTSAQFRRGRGASALLRTPTPDSFDGGFNFCRVMFSQQPRWATAATGASTIPRADINLSIRLAELTKTRVSLDATGEPNHVVVAPDRQSCSSARSS